MPLFGLRRSAHGQQGRANAVLLVVARDLEANFVEPGTNRGYGAVRGRMSGCAFELGVATPAGGGAPGLALTMRHFHTQQTWPLDGPGCTMADLDPVQVRAAIEQACSSFSSTH